MLSAARVVTAQSVLTPGWVRVNDQGWIVAVGEGEIPAHSDAFDDVLQLGDVTLVPGFVDMHCHGGGGVHFSDGPDAARAARAAHLAHGTTSTLASLVTEGPAQLLAQVRDLLPFVADGTLAGIHLEGPWLSVARKGAHAEQLLRDPLDSEINALLQAGTYTRADGEPGQAIRMVTIAPELPGALGAIRRLSAAGVLVAVGHTDADSATTEAAIEAGATVATHLFNAMRPLHHREPGPVLPLMRAPGVALELVADGTHLHAELPFGVEEAAGVDRVIYVTDAMAAAAHADGNYQLGELNVEVHDGVAKLAGTDTIAGSTATMDRLFRGRALAAGGNAGVAGVEIDPHYATSLVAATLVTATNPARVLGLNDRGEIACGKRADLVVLSPGLDVESVFVAGKPVL